MIKAFCELELDFLTVSETWFKTNRMTNQQLKDLMDTEGISCIKKNRELRGGGVAVLLENKKVTLKMTYPFTKDIEAVCAVGKTVNDVRKLFVVSFYLPPKSSADHVGKFCNQLAERIERIKSEQDDPYIVIAGDQNRKDICAALTHFPDMAQVKLVATRGSSKLDTCYTNFSDRIKEVIRCDPLHDQTTLVKSDHDLLSVECHLQRLDNFNKIRIRRRHYTVQGEEKFGLLLDNLNWSELKKRSASESVAYFEERLMRIVDECFPLRTIVKKSTDKTWYTK